MDKYFEYQIFKKDTIEVKEKVKIVNPMQVNIGPQDSWDPRTNYLLRVKDDLLQDTIIEITISVLNYIRYNLRVFSKGKSNNI